MEKPSLIVQKVPDAGVALRRPQQFTASKRRQWGIASTSFVHPDISHCVDEHNKSNGKITIKLPVNIADTSLLNAADEDDDSFNMDAMDLSSRSRSRSSLSSNSSSGRKVNKSRSQHECNYRLPTNSHISGTVHSGGIGSSSVDKSPPPLEPFITPSAANAKPSAKEENCDICGKTFAVPARLTRHYRTHTGERPFVCEVCGKSFSVKENLSVHRRIHTKEKPYCCTHCGRGFEHSGKLHRHMRIHTGERPHQCTACGKTFIQSGQLVIHMRSHTGEKPYVCTVCKKGFTCSKQLKVHSRTHTGERPYACDTCGKTFAYNHVLKLHMMAHLGERLYKCTICSETHTSKKALESHIKSHVSAFKRPSVVTAAAASTSMLNSKLSMVMVEEEKLSLYGAPPHLTPDVSSSAPSATGTKCAAMNLRQHREMQNRNVSSVGSCVIDQHQPQKQQQVEQSSSPVLVIDFDRQSPLSSGDSSRNSPSDLDAPNSNTSFSNPKQINKSQSSLQKHAPRVQQQQEDISTSYLRMMPPLIPI